MALALVAALQEANIITEVSRNIESSQPLIRTVANQGTLKGLPVRKEEATPALSYLQGGPLEVRLPKGAKASPG